jgi:hypothetical protein
MVEELEVAFTTGRSLTGEAWYPTTGDLGTGARTANARYTHRFVAALVIDGVCSEKTYPTAA